ncbi:murein L,D-transpeptidase family protein [Aquidulcibacter sp.]|jgi:murein L,D-transpeptidase YafK|uniref:murein L,D-transpeptidase family protein n=1 Tax=Aquidulcibacter sp. TaxID=2052990 RepID=UPI0037C0EDA2
MITRRKTLMAPACVLPTVGAACSEQPLELPGPQRAAVAIERAAPKVTERLRALGASLGDPVFIRAYKQEKRLYLYVQPGRTGRFIEFASWPICAASGLLGPKEAEGDKQVPEGVYGVTPEAMNNASSYHLSMNVGYPNALDQSLGRTGSFIMIHGRCESIGCLAMTDPVIEDIWTLVSAAHQAGQAKVDVHIFPCVLSEKALAGFAESKHLLYWTDLMAIQNAFDRTGKPPIVAVNSSRYVVVG